jgi:hypothetical protein
MFYTQNGKENKREIIKIGGYHHPINEINLRLLVVGGVSKELV